RPTGELDADKVCQAVAAVLPEGAIVSDEAQTSGVTLSSLTAGSPRHDLLALTGGAIGQGLPVAVGAAIACPDRPVIALEGDGSVISLTRRPPYGGLRRLKSGLRLESTYPNWEGSMKRVLVAALAVFMTVGVASSAEGAKKKPLKVTANGWYVFDHGPDGKV